MKTIVNQHLDKETNEFTVTHDYRKPFDINNQKSIEKIFDVNLDKRHWNISIDNREVELTFYEDDNCFGWLERISITKFLSKLEKLKLYITWTSKT